MADAELLPFPKDLDGAIKAIDEELARDPDEDDAFLISSATVESQDPEIRSALADLDAMVSDASPKLAESNADLRPDGEVVAADDPQMAARLAALEKSVTVVIGPAATMTSEQQFWQRGSFWMSAFGAVLVGTGASAATLFTALYEYISNKSKGTPDPWSGELSADQQAALDLMVAAWLQLPDSELWDYCARFSDEHNPLPSTQIFICQDIISFSPTVTWPWTATEKAAQVDSLLSVYQASAYKASAVWNALKTATFNNTPLPRSIAADCAKLAFVAPIQSQGDSTHA